MAPRWSTASPAPPISTRWRKLFADGGTVSIGLIIGIVFIAVGLAFKVSAVPFHMWTPDVYEGAPTPVTAFFSVAPKIAAIALFVRVMVEPFGGLIAEWRQIIWFISVASMLLGSFAAINQRNIKRLMAYSSIGHVGYALIGLAAGSAAGVRGVLVYHGDLSLHECRHLRRHPVHAPRRPAWSRTIGDLAGLSRTQPGLALALAIFMFSMAGIPPLAGFFAKLYVFLAAIDAGLYVLAVIGVLTSVVGAYLLPAHRQADVFRRAGGGASTARSGARCRRCWSSPRSSSCSSSSIPGLVVDGADAVAAALFAG